MKLAVCSWSYRMSAAQVAAEMENVGFDGCLAVEREAGNDRAGDIAAAVGDLKKRGAEA